MDTIVAVIGSVLGIFGTAVAVTAETGRATVAGVVMMVAGAVLLFVAASLAL